MPILQLLFNKVLEVLARASREEKERKDTQIGKQEIKLPLFTGDTILYIKNSKGSIKNKQAKKLLELVSEFSKGA